jgi:hypothetical protein
VLEAVLIAAVVVGVLACPAMMWLGRRGIGPGCAMMSGCEPAKSDADTLDELRRREREVATRIAALERELPVEAAPRD